MACMTPVMSIHCKDWCWSWSSKTLATWCSCQLIRKDPDAGKDWRQEGKGTRGRNGWMASPNQWTLVWASSGRWRTGKPGVLQFMGSYSRTRLSDWTLTPVDCSLCLSVFGGSWKLANKSQRTDLLISQDQILEWGWRINSSELDPAGLPALPLNSEKCSSQKGLVQHPVASFNRIIFWSCIKQTDCQLR